MPLWASCALRTGVLLSITQVKTQASQHTSVTPVLGQGKTSVCGGRGKGQQVDPQSSLAYQSNQPMRTRFSKRLF